MTIAPCWKTHQILSNQPSVSIEHAAKVYDAAAKYSRVYGVPVNLILAIMNVESSYKLNAVNAASDDYGIMQVNEYHVRKSKLNKQRLLTDLDYSVKHGVRVLQWFYQTYPLDEAIMRYNCGTRKQCTKWFWVKRYLKKVKESM